MMSLEFLTRLMWGAAVLLLALLLLLAVRGKFLAKYPIFYSYLSLLLGISLLGMHVYISQPEEYLIFYWNTQFVSVAASFCVIWELYTQVLKHYPGTGKIARAVNSFFFLAVLGEALLRAIMDPMDLVRSVAALERNLRAVEALLLLVLLALVRYYLIPLGRNVQGVILGYGFSLATSTALLALYSYLGTSFQVWWQYLQQVCALATLGIFTATLWSYHPNPEPEAEIGLERDYAMFAEQTARAITNARRHLIRVFLP